MQKRKNATRKEKLAKIDSPGDKQQKTKPSKEGDAKIAALEKSIELLQKSLEDSLAQTKENDKKRKKEESEAFAITKALKKAVDAAEKAANAAEKDRDLLRSQLKEEQEKGIEASTAIARVSTVHVPRPVLAPPPVPPLYSNIGGGHLQNSSPSLPHMMSTAAGGQQYYMMAADQQHVPAYPMNMQPPPPTAQGQQSIPIGDVYALYMMMQRR